ncbi:DVU0259 family response regulator domain-containing protein [Humidesulfovibrio sp.]|uniref:DVU0259 family response regulator domain-containing protein n=1 Tax=Humidesulfovibrio sp. TaxID=2910988 RepID=UPI0039C8803E
MRLTTKGRYGMRLVLDIAQHEKYGPVSMAETSLRQDISAKYLERLVGELQRAGVVKSLRGREGGHLLAMPPEKITVGDVVRILEGEAAELACSHNRLSCPRSVHCLTRAIWVAADQAMFEKLDSVTVRDIIEDGQNCLSVKEAEQARLARGLPAAPPPAPDIGGRRKAVRRILRQRLAMTMNRAAKPEGAPKKIMVVDDDPDIVDYLVTVFRDRGYATCSANGGVEATEVLIRENPDLITLDLEMPEEWGPRFSRRVSRLPEFKHVPIIVISGLPGIHMAIPRAVATVRKPFDPAEVLGLVESAIGAP